MCVCVCVHLCCVSEVKSVCVCVCVCLCVHLCGVSEVKSYVLRRGG